MTTNKGNVLFYGPFTPDSKIDKRRGGGEVGNKKTVNILSKLGYCMSILAKPYPKKIKILRVPIYFSELLLVIIKSIYKCLCLRRNLIVHISGFYSHLIYVEFIMVLIGKFFRCYVIYEVRAGGMIW